MSNSPNSGDSPVLMGYFASVMAILAFFLYFTGWIYRWAYFAFFQLQVTTKDLILVSGILLILFWIARYQGTVDARRDAIDKTSLLPVVTFATPKNLIPLGRNPDDVSTIPSLQDYKLIRGATTGGLPLLFF